MRKYAIIEKIGRSESLLLVEVSRHGWVTWTMVRFYEPHVTYCPEESNDILSAINKNNRYVIYRDEILRMVLDILNVDSGAEVSGAYFKELAIDVIGRTYTYNIMSPQTRAQHNDYLNVMKDWKIVRKKRLRQEMHLGLSFISDIERTFVEINFVLSSV
mmetsp:Transcript_12858/g.18359  ORF Transcript_12858/g.18359 Transcript_12858/m.18359 type:complete len:159 (+) Transcript_12858:174-650(+)